MKLYKYWKCYAFEIKILSASMVHNIDNKVSITKLLYGGFHVLTNF